MCCEGVIVDRDEIIFVEVVYNERKILSLSLRCYLYGVYGVYYYYVMCYGEVVIVRYVCISLRKREVGLCCRSYRNKCCGSLYGYFVVGLGGLIEIIIE